MAAGLWVRKRRVVWDMLRHQHAIEETREEQELHRDSVVRAGLTGPYWGLIPRQSYRTFPVGEARLITADSTVEEVVAMIEDEVLADWPTNHVFVESLSINGIFLDIQTGS